MQSYLELLRHILDHGERRLDRTGVGTLSVFGYQSRYDLSAGFPLVTTKKCAMRSIVVELLWFLRGDTNTSFLREHGVTIWDEWANTQGELGPVYGHQWRSWGRPWKGSSDPGAKGIDQISGVLQQLRERPQSRRHIVSAWNVADIEHMALPPCHTLFQFYVHNDGRLSCQLYQRSADVFLGVPFNIASYSLLALMMAQVLGLKPGFFIHTLGDAHLYLNHVEQTQIQMQRQPRPLPKLVLNPEVKDLFAFKPEDIRLEAYDPHPAIKAPIAV